jgi:deoxyribonuclease IV
MPILGAHQSIAGGYDQAVKRAKQRGCQCVQLFTKNTNQWSAKPITFAEAERFRTVLDQLGITHPIAHDSYLINLASPDSVLWEKSVAAFVEELRRADQLGIPYVVTHPGAFTTGNEAQGLKNVIRAINVIHLQAEERRLSAECLLETTAGQGTNLGWRFEHLSTILGEINMPHRVGVCFDTCHVFAAGYALAGEKDYKATMAEFDRLVGIGRIKAFPLNDSQRGLGSRIDRHAHIGRGSIGGGAFRNLLCDPRFQHVPMYLETPKGEENGVDLDEINLRVLREYSGSDRDLK